MNLIKSLSLLLALQLFFSLEAKAHHLHDSMKSDASISGSSIFQLDSIWKDQKNHEIKLSEFNGKSQIIVMLYTHCETSCPLIVEDLKSIAKELELTQPHKFNVSIFSLDSGRETPESLRTFALKRKLPESWHLLTSSENAVTELAAALGVRFKRLKNGDFIHSNTLFFLNDKGEVVAQKEGLKTPQESFIKRINSILQ